MNVQEYLNKFFKGTKGPTLKAMEFFMDEFNHPEKNQKFIHIAGTNGKGSCVEMITNILIKEGYKVGKFISPHLVKYNERISINNKNISDEEIEELINKIDPKVNKYNSENNSNVTGFEFDTTMALLYFANNNCDFVVLETGLGGLFDCTNIVKPIISIITSIGYDHMWILGDSLTKIAEQKAGIIKENSETIYVEQEEKDVNNIILKTCIEKNNKLHLIQEKDISNYSYNKDFQKFDYKNNKDVLINLKGKKQIYNASICIECIEILKNKSYKISDESLRAGLKTVVHKARFETINNDPLIIYDGAHNIPAIENLKNTINMHYKNNEKIYIVSILKNKDYNSILKELLKDEKSIFIFTSGNGFHEFVSKEELLTIAKSCTNNKNLYAEELEKALDLAKEKYKTHTTFIVGSFYIYGNVEEYLKGNKND
ncbi:MAG: bifunctional folylpolyglutamate synthase/dihydrofolate synthase [Clostridia bacterium]|nr:bifunctional folylpolyglutamate synthase/dihydrofolate synthase [Clostridia bacterium]